MDKYLLLCFCVMVIIGIVNTYDSQLMPDEFFDDGLAETARGRMASFAMVTWTVGSLFFFLVPKWYQDSQMYNEKYIGRWWRNKNLRSVVDHSRKPSRGNRGHVFGVNLRGYGVSGGECANVHVAPYATVRRAVQLMFLKLRTWQAISCS